MTAGACRKCGEPVAVLTTRRCPACGYDPVREHRGKYRLHKWLSVLGLVSFVGIPIVPFTVYYGLKHKRAMEAGVAEPPGDCDGYVGTVPAVDQPAEGCSCGCYEHGIGSDTEGDSA